MPANWDGVKAKAREIREKYALNKPPINAFDIANAEGIKIVYFTPNDDTKDISGLLDKINKKIYLNSHESAARQNYTLAHELAHLFLDHKANEYGVYRRDSLYEQKSEKEQEADYFAAELLMPQELVNKVKTRYSLTDNDVIALSKLFGVSPSAMKFRLKNLQRE